MTNYIKYWNNAEEVVYWFREWGAEAKLVHNEIEWKTKSGSGYMRMGQTVVAHSSYGQLIQFLVQ